MNDIIKLTDISKTYVIGGVIEVPALKSVSVYIKENEYVAIMGPSGSG